MIRPSNGCGNFILALSNVAMPRIQTFFIPIRIPSIQGRLTNLQVRYYLKACLSLCINMGISSSLTGYAFAKGHLLQIDILSFCSRP